MSKVRETAALHPSTVTRVAELQGAFKGPRPSRREAAKLTVERVDPLVLAAAHGACREGERLVLVSATEVLLVPDTRYRD